VSTLPIAGSLRRPLDAVALLQNHPIFGELAPGQIKQLSAFARRRHVAGGTTLFVKGDAGTALFALCSGSVKITAPSSDGRETMFSLLQTGEIFGEIALLDGRPRTADAVALSDCELIVIERRDFLALLHSEPKVGMKLIELLCARLRLTDQRLEEIAFLNLPARLARLLLRLLEEKTAAAAGNKLNITQREISHMLGVTRESVNRLLQVWAKRKLIALKRGSIVVVAPQAVAALVRGEDAGDGSPNRPGAREP
jgi:CRP/FNR family transcriptional regulator, cyclic AMP receptor protein